MRNAEGPLPPLRRRGSGCLKLEGPLLTGWSVYPRSATGATGRSRSRRTTSSTAAPSSGRPTRGRRARAEGLGLPEESGLKLEETWHVEPGRDDGEIWLGATPGILFRSADGESFEPVQSMLDHPTREKWEPGAGGMCCHSIQLDPSDPNRMYVAISAAGTFRTDDGAESWSPANKGVAADFFPSRTTSRRLASASTSCCSTPSGPTASAAEPLRRVPLGRPGRDLGAARRGTGLPSGFGFRSRSIRAIPTLRT